MEQGFHDVFLMCNVPQRRLLKLDYSCPKPFNRSWMLVACGSALKVLEAAALSKSKKGLAGRKVGDPPS
jgi:hypothetical protein